MGRYKNHIWNTPKTKYPIGQFKVKSEVILALRAAQGLYGRLSITHLPFTLKEFNQLFRRAVTTPSIKNLVTVCQILHCKLDDIIEY